MAYKTFAAIYVGSSEIAMKIYELTARDIFQLSLYVRQPIYWTVSRRK